MPSQTWRKSSRSGDSGQCVEVAAMPEAVAIRDSKDPKGPILTSTLRQWHKLRAAVLRGSYDLRVQARRDGP